MTDKEKIEKIKEIINENKYDNQEFGASYSQLQNDIDEIREIINR